jgi:hypothetical protein
MCELRCYRSACGASGCILYLCSNQCCPLPPLRTNIVPNQRLLMTLAVHFKNCCCCCCCTVPPGPTSGVHYIRWGRTTCPNTEGTGIVYSGVAAGSWYTHKGGGSGYLCLPDKPEFLKVKPGQQHARSLLFGTEYQAEDSPAFKSMLNHNAPCVLCHTPERGDQIMIPGMVTCPSFWTREYVGYLMSDFHGHHRTSYVCVDADPESVPGSAADINGALFYFTEVRCHGINCPPYAEGSELACVVCTK